MQKSRRKRRSWQLSLRLQAAGREGKEATRFPGVFSASPPLSEGTEGASERIWEMSCRRAGSTSAMNKRERRMSNVAAQRDPLVERESRERRKEEGKSHPPAPPPESARYEGEAAKAGRGLEMQQHPSARMRQKATDDYRFPASGASRKRRFHSL
nr:hypothetical protein CFP56_57853 [Quercus suber]